MARGPPVPPVLEWNLAGSDRRQPKGSLNGHEGIRGGPCDLLHSGHPQNPYPNRQAPLRRRASKLDALKHDAPEP
eukprot:8814511-Alexandrium_andersonii.AAC.1